MGELFFIYLKEMLMYYKDNSSILIRAAFILGNLTTQYEECRKVLIKEKTNVIAEIFDLLTHYFVKDLNLQKEDEIKDSKKKKSDDFNFENVEDALTKLIRLMANLLTEPEIAEKLH
jgi:hypothetical protein